MCIICNLHGKEGLADNFLATFYNAQKAMREATDAMQACAKADKRYDRTHKKMRKLMRAWNRLEQEREIELPKLVFSEAPNVRN